MKGPRDPTHLTCTFVTAMEGNKRWVKARITTSAGSLVEVLEARNEAFLRARIEEIYPGIYYPGCKALECAPTPCNRCGKHIDYDDARRDPKNGEPWCGCP